MGRPKGKRQDRKQPPLETDAGPLRDPHGLRPRERRFVIAYCGVAMGNAAKAYAIAGYKPGRENASRLMTKDHIAGAIKDELAARNRALIADGDEAMQHITLIKRGDIGAVLHPDHPIAKLPKEARLTIKSVRATKYGLRIELYDSLKAAELLAKADGKLKETVKVEHSLEEILAASNAAPAEEERPK